MRQHFTIYGPKIFRLMLLLISMLSLSMNAHAVSDTVCAYTDSHQYTTPYDSGHSYTWTVKGGNIIQGQNTDTILVNWKSGNDTGVIKLTETNLSNCDSTVRDSIYITPKPAPAISGKDTVCAFTNSHAYTTSNKSGYTYNWTVTGGTIESGSGTDSITVDWQGTDSGNVQLKATNASGCDTTVNKPIHIDPRPTTAISGKDTLCTNSTTGYSTSGTAGSSYSWTVTGGTIQNGSGTDSITVNWGSSGSGKVKLTETNGSGCDTTVSKDITIDPKPSPVIQGKSPICEESVTAYHVNSDSTHTFSWTVSGGTITKGSGTDSITVEWGSSGSGTVSLTETNNQGCDTSVSKNINIDKKPEPVIQGRKDFCEGDRAFVFLNNRNPAISYQWKIQGGTIHNRGLTDTIQINWSTPEQSGVAMVTAKNRQGCFSTDTHNMEIHPKPDPQLEGPV